MVSTNRSPMFAVFLLLVIFLHCPSPVLAAQKTTRPEHKSYKSVEDLCLQIQSEEYCVKAMEKNYNVTTLANVAINLGEKESLRLIGHISRSLLRKRNKPAATAILRTFDSEIREVHLAFIELKAPVNNPTSRDEETRHESIRKMMWAAYVVRKCRQDLEKTKGFRDNAVLKSLYALEAVYYIAYDLILEQELSLAQDH